MAGQSKKMRQEALDEEPGLMMTPMVDIVFQLLIFFMLACRFRTTEGQIHAFLPKNRGLGTEGPAAITLQEMRIKLLWVERNSLRETRNPEDGRVLLKVRDLNFPTVENEFREEMPDYTRLYEKICQARDNFTPTRSYGSLPVIIDARSYVPFKHVIFALNECVRAGIDDITFAAPEIDY